MVTPTFIIEPFFSKGGKPNDYNSKGDAKAIKEKQDKPAVKEKTQAPPKVKEQTETNIDEIKNPRQRKQPYHVLLLSNPGNTR